jgi:hypothetical protein
MCNILWEGGGVDKDVRFESGWALAWSYDVEAYGNSHVGMVSFGGFQGEYIHSLGVHFLLRSGRIEVCGFAILLCLDYLFRCY